MVKLNPNLSRMMELEKLQAEKKKKEEKLEDLEKTKTELNEVEKRLENAVADLMSKTSEEEIVDLSEEEIISINLEAALINENSNITEILNMDFGGAAYEIESLLEPIQVLYNNTSQQEATASEVISNQTMDMIYRMTKDTSYEQLRQKESRMKEGVEDAYSGRWGTWSEIIESQSDQSNIYKDRHRS